MSLLDALLLDPAPFDVWIALRTDGLKGSGEGRLRRAPQLVVSVVSVAMAA